MHLWVRGFIGNVVAGGTLAESYLEERADAKQRNV